MRMTKSLPVLSSDLSAADLSSLEQSMSSKSAQTTKTSNTSVNLKRSPADKHVGWNFYKILKTNLNISLAHPTLSLTSYPVAMTLTRGWILTNLESSYPTHSSPEKSSSKTTQKNDDKPSDKSTTLLQEDTLVSPIPGSWLENTMKAHNSESLSKNT